MSNNKPCWWWVIPCKDTRLNGTLVFTDSRQNAIGKVCQDGRYAVATPLSWRGLRVLTGCVIPGGYEPSALAEGCIMLVHNGRMVKVQP